MPKHFVAPQIELKENPRVVPLPQGAVDQHDWNDPDEFVEALRVFEQKLAIASSTPCDHQAYWLLNTKVTAESMLNLLDSQPTKLGYREHIRQRYTVDNLQEQVDMCCRMWCHPSMSYDCVIVLFAFACMFLVAASIRVRTRQVLLTSLS